VDDGDLQDIITRGNCTSVKLLSALCSFRAVSNFSVSDVEPKGHETTHDALVR